MLDGDALRLIADCSLETTFKVALVCREWRDIVEDGHCAHYLAWCALIRLGETSLMGELVTTLRLTPKKLKRGEYTQKRRWGGGCYNIFARDACIRLFHAEGSFDGIEKRLARYQRKMKV